MSPAGPATGSNAAVEKRERSVADESGAKPQLAVLQNRMVIRTAQLAIRVDNVETSEKSVSAIVRSFGGYVGNTSSTDLDSDHPALSLTIRIPAEHFDTVLSKLEELGIRISKVTNSEDVTEQVVDMDARIKTMLAQEETYRHMLKQSRRLEDIIQMQEQLTQIRANIESIAAQRKSLATRAQLSTITLTLQQGAIAHKPAKDPNWMSAAWAESTSKMAGILRSGTVSLIWLLVFSPFWVPLLIFAWRGFRAITPKKVEA